MKMKFNRKMVLSGALAAVIVLTMAAPGLLAYAANYDDPANIVFDPQRGPGLQLSSYGSSTSEDGALTIYGKMGHALLEYKENFGGVVLDLGGSGKRPELPGFVSDIWEGYAFDHWEREDGSKLIRLPYAFPYAPVTRYKAVWKGTDSKTYGFRVEHLRNLAGLSIWPEASDYDDPNKIRKFFDGDWNLPRQKANTTVSATYRRDIPGYKLGNVQIRNNYILDFAKNQKEEVASINEATHGVRGHMPNDDLTVAYQYVPDDSKKFTVTVKGVTKVKEVTETPEGSYTTIIENPIGQPHATLYHAEEEYVVLPLDVEYYEVDGEEPPRVEGEVTGYPETDRLSDKGVVTVAQAGYDYLPNLGHEIIGKMPNQNVAITYTYTLRSDVRTMISVISKDENGTPLGDAVATEALVPGAAAAVTIEEKPGYAYPPNVSWSEGLTNVEFQPAAGKVAATPGIDGGTVTCVYNEDHSNKEFWVKLEFYNDPHGGFAAEGFRTPQFVKKNADSGDLGISVRDLTRRLRPEGSEHYAFGGWYETANGVDKSGPQLGDDARISHDTKLYADFIKKPGDWVDISFDAGPHGSLSGTGSLNVIKNTAWGDVETPVPSAQSNQYAFSGWVREDGSMVETATELFSGSQRYLAKFAPTYDPETAPVITDAKGSIGGDGTGRVVVSGVNVNRSYALAGLDGRVREVKTGLSMHEDGFAGLAPSTAYQVYELAQGQNPPLETPLPDGLDEELCSLPALVTVPALGRNYEAGAGDDGGMRIRIAPPAPETVYAVLDDEGQVASHGDDDGWVAASGSEVILDGLQANQLYTVVAKGVGETARAEDKRFQGTQVSTPPALEEEEGYTLGLLGGGFIKEIKDGKGNVTYRDGGDRGKTTALVKKGDRIWIDAPETVGEGEASRGFARWSQLVGDMADPSALAKRNPRFNMTKGNLVMRPDYAPAEPVAGRGAAFLDYSPKNESTTPDLWDDGLGTGLAALIDNSEDKEALANNANVRYTVKLDRHAPTATQSNAARARFGEGAGHARAPWILSLSLTRKVAGNNAPLPSEAAGFNPAPEITVYSEIDRGAWGYADYKLSREDGLDPDGNLLLADVEMTPVEAGDGTFTGAFSFEARVGSTYVMSYLKAHKVAIHDQVHTENEGVFYAASGLPLNEAEGYGDLNRDGYEDVYGAPFEFKGLAPARDSALLYDDGLPITKNLVLYAIYGAADDSEWRAAWESLKNLEDEIKNMMSRLPEGEGKEGLLEALNLAHAALNVVPRSDKESLGDHYAILTQLLSAITGNQPGGGEPGDGGSQPGGGHSGGGSHPGSGSHSGGGGHSGGGSHSGSTGSRKLGPSNDFGGYKTYFVGIEGQWEKTGERWNFVLKDGSPVRNSFVNVIYDDARHGRTYHFDGEGLMDDGWYQDGGKNSYYLNEGPGAEEGSLAVGWHYDPGTGHWYYFNQLNGIMATGWQQIGDGWYYLSPVSLEDRPLGALYTNEVTPDGFSVDNDGRWLRDLPGLGGAE